MQLLMDDELKFSEPATNQWLAPPSAIARSRAANTVEEMGFYLEIQLKLNNSI